MTEFEELQAKVDYLIALQKKQIEPIKQVYLFDWLDEYLKTYKVGRVSKSRQYEIESIIRLHIKPHIQNKLLVDYLPIDIENALNLVENGRTRETTYQVYNESFRLARKNKLLINNIMEDSEVTIDTLISAGLLSRELTNPLTDLPITNYNDNIVTITWSNNKRTCNYTLPEISQ